MQITKTVSSFMFAGSVLALACGQASATTIISASAAIQGNGIGNGLAGTFWHVPVSSTNYSIADTLAAKNANAATGSFTSSAVAYYGVDNSSITSFLGADGASYVGTVTDLSDGILEFKGYIKVNGPGTINFGLNHDDAAQLSIGNQVLISQNCCGFQVEDAVFSQAGMYAFNLVYANTYYFGVGGATLELTADGAILSGGLFQSVPEPGSVTLMLAGAIGLLGAARRRKSTKK